MEVLPSWLDDGRWTLADIVVDTSDELQRVYCREYAAGPVTLGGNSMAPMSDAESNYNVVVVTTVDVS